MAFFNDESFRGDEPGCMQMSTSMENLLGDGKGAIGQGEWAGLAAISHNEMHGVWFHEDVLGTTVAYSERRRVVYHEAAHLAFLTDDNQLAEAAAAYCAGVSSENPWGDPL